ncbi:MAG: pseudouridine synthase [Deltaproteobacteria bacterium]|nr:MAG: pseudouridine synthase [Deltaproteobacteria bacterium]
MPLIRLQKFLSEAGVCSRRKGESQILAGNVSVNGRVVDLLGTKIDPDIDRVHLNGRRVMRRECSVYVMLNKPEGIVTSCRHRGEPVVTDLVGLPQRLFPVGRLDRQSTGMLLLTNDGRIHHRLSHPSFDHEKEYDVTVQWPIADDALAAMSAGMSLSGQMTRPARVRRVSGRRFRIVLKEGKNRQIRRMVKKTGNRVVRLHRIRVAGLTLGNLAKGSWRHLTPGETRRLLQGLKLEPLFIVDQ